MFDSDPLSAMDAIAAAQQLAFAPLAFHAASVMRERGVLAALAEAGREGLAIDAVATSTGLSTYAARVLLEAGLGMRIVFRRGDRFHLGKVGQVLLNDEMTRVNFDFSRDVCYAAAAHLDEALSSGAPSGLRSLGPWATLYQGLSVLPEPARRSWFAFDHFYSDQAFPAVCDRLASEPPARLLDVGCNTGKWARMCLERFPRTVVGLADLPIQLAVAREQLHAAGLLERARLHPLDLLDPEARLPGGYDLIWMSQLLDCFSEEQIVAVLRKVRAALPPGGRLWILELFWDRQRFEAAAFSLQQTSLYFSCVANGNSQMYDSKVFLSLLPRAGLAMSRLTDGVGRFHTLVECSAAEAARRGSRGRKRRRRGRRAMTCEPRAQPTLSSDGVWIVIPAYNEERTIRAVAEAALSLGLRVIVVDDGSTDTTVERLHGLPLTLLRHSCNQGKAASLRTAFRHALALDATCVVTLDGDGQHDPGDAPKLLAVWRRRPDCLVIGARLHDRSQFPPIRYFGNRFACFWISWAAGHPVADSQSGFRVYPRAVMEIAVSARAACSRFTFESEIIIAAAERGQPTLAVAIEGRYPRDARPSHYRSVVDTAKIVAMVASRLLAKGLYPLGLWRSLQRPQVLVVPVGAVLDRQG